VDQIKSETHEPSGEFLGGSPWGVLPSGGLPTRPTRPGLGAPKARGPPRLGSPKVGGPQGLPAQWPTKLGNAQG
jgi:hypothetical protein